jgi:redox-sensitive bicupin YhaK (pirin superfamily)
MTTDATRSLFRVIPSVAASDGAGVKLRRSLGSTQMVRHDPFLMLDEFFSDNPDDYLAGFPSHPHRGFETVTYMLDGHMRHEDSNGNTGDLGPGDVQWMTAARGIIHSEMPQQTEGRMRGFQLWLNLPGREKMKPAAYRDIPSKEIPVVEVASGAKAKVIAGVVEGSGKDAGKKATGPIGGLSTDPRYIDYWLEAGAVVKAPLPAGHNAFVYVYDGDALLGQTRQPVPNRAAGLLSDGEGVRIEAGARGARLLLLAGIPINEPVVQYGPFVMNTRAEIEQAIADYNAGTLARN